MPYCTDLKTCEELIKFGFDINQVDENGRTLLINLFKRSTINFKEMQRDLFNYVINSADTSIKDIFNKTALFYALFTFSNESENKKSNRPSNNELSTIQLIMSMDMEHVNESIIHDAINYRYGANDSIDERMELNLGWMNQKLNYKRIYHQHKKLFDALISKGYQVDREFLENMYDSLFFPILNGQIGSSDNQYSLSNVESNLDYITISYIMKNLDLNTKFLDKNPKSSYNDLMNIVYNDDVYQNIDETKDIFYDFNNLIGEYIRFREEEISQKFDSNVYMEFAKFRYGIDYKNLDIYFVNIFIGLIKRMDNSQLPLLSELLDTCTNFDINAELEDEFIDFNESINNRLISHGVVGCDENNNPIYDEDYIEPKYVNIDDSAVYFTGNLMQYAILTNNIELAKLLHSKGASYEYIYNGDDHTLNYINSLSMKEHIEKVTGLSVGVNLQGDEANYYRRLIRTPKNY
jgi:hypothetical protein